MLLVDDGSTDGSRALAAGARGRGAAAPAARLGRHPRAPRRRATPASAPPAAASSPSSTPTTSGGRRSSRAQLGFMAATGCPLRLLRLPPDRRGRPAARRRPPAPARVTHATLLKGNCIGCLTAVYDTAALGRVEMPPFARRQDYGLWLTLLAARRRGLGLAGGARRLPGAAGLAVRRTGSPPPAPPGRSCASTKGCRGRWPATTSCTTPGARWPSAPATATAAPRRPSRERRCLSGSERRTPRSGRRFGPPGADRLEVRLGGSPLRRSERCARLRDPGSPAPSRGRVVGESRVASFGPPRPHCTVPTRPGKVTLDMGDDPVPVGTLRSIWRQAGWDW